MITLHHLAYSRSTRILWLLEELGVDYDLVRYDRTKEFRAPPELAAVQPLGKSPTLVDGDLTIGESATILRYLDRKYGDGRFAPAARTDEAAIHDEWLSYVESTLGLPVMMRLIGGMSGGLSDGMAKFADGGLKRNFDYLSDGIGEGPFLMGERVMLADMQMTYMLAMANHAGLLDGHPRIVAYLDRLMEQPGLKRAIEKGGPMTPPKS